MSTVSPAYPDPVEAKVVSLSATARQHGHDADLLRRACANVAAQGMPLRDAIVLREADRLAAMQTDRARTAWATAREKLAGAVRESTFRIWLEPLSVAGENGSTLTLTAPERKHAWVQRRYSHLITEALEGTGFEKVEFVSEGGTA